MMFQAGLSLHEWPFEQEVEEEPLEPLRMEHFYFPLLLWTVGLGLSALSFIAEIFIKCIGQRAHREINS